MRDGTVLEKDLPLILNPDIIKYQITYDLDGGVNNPDNPTEYCGGDLPIELKKLIDNKKQSTLRLTYTTKDYTYIVAGYGTKETSGYSIRVDDVYVSGNAVYADFKLIGPAEGEQVNEVSTTPYIVLKYEKRDESVVFKM